jgi:hypothetical protein
MTLKTLKAKGWYRLVKVVYVGAFLIVTALWLLLVAAAYPPLYSLAENRSTVACTSGNQSVFTLSELDDHEEIAAYFREASAPGNLPPMPDRVWRSLETICGLPLKDLLDSAPVPLEIKNRAWQLFYTPDPEQTTEDSERFRSRFGDLNLSNHVVYELWGLWRSTRANTYVKDLRQRHPIKIEDVPASYQEWVVQHHRTGQSAYFIAEALADEFPTTFQIVHVIPEVSTVLLGRKELAAAKQVEVVTGQPNPFRIPAGFAFHEVSSIVLSLDPQVRDNYKPTTAIIYLAHEGGWPRTVRVAGFGILGIGLAFEIIRRVFYYVVIGRFMPSE